MTTNGSNARGSQGGGGERRESLSRLNILIATTAALVGLIYGYDLGSIASALLFLVPAFGLSTFMTSVVTSAVVLGRLPDLRHLPPVVPGCHRLRVHPGS